MTGDINNFNVAKQTDFLRRASNGYITKLTNVALKNWFSGSIIVELEIKSTAGVDPTTGLSPLEALK